MQLFLKKKKKFNCVQILRKAHNFMSVNKKIIGKCIFSKKHYALQLFIEYLIFLDKQL